MSDEAITRRDLLARLKKWSMAVVGLAMGVGGLTGSSCSTQYTRYTIYSVYSRWVTYSRYTIYTVYSRAGSLKDGTQVRPKEATTSIAYCNYADYCDAGCGSDSGTV
jgi:hypothetical protein